MFTGIADHPCQVICVRPIGFLANEFGIRPVTLNAVHTGAFTGESSVNPTLYSYIRFSLSKDFS